MADSPLIGSDGPVGITIKLAGKVMKDDTQVLWVRTSHSLNRIPEACFAIKATTVLIEDFEELESADYALGTEVEIAGYYGAGAEDTIFKGLLVSYRLRSDESRGTRMEITCRDKAISLTGVRSSAAYADSKDSEVMSRIIGDAGLEAQVTATTSLAPLNLRVGTSDWDFLRLLADRNGHVLQVADGKITSAPIDTSPAPVLTVSHGQDIFEIDVTVDAQRMIGKATTSAWSTQTQDVVTSENNALTNETFGNTPMSKIADVLSKRAFLSATARDYEVADLSGFSKVRMTRARAATIRGTVTFQGSGKIGPGDILEITGTGDRFGGKGYVSSVDHSLSGGVWSTTVRLGLPQDWTTDTTTPGTPGAEALTAPVHGLQIGKVIQVGEDPDGKLRIKVSLPMIGQPAAEVWARHATPYATSNAGIQFLPEVGDEVVVAFLSADPNAPVIVGALHNPVAPRKTEAINDNFIKSIVTREGLSMTFDDEKKIITLETPGGHKVTMDDDATKIAIEDSNGNSIVMDSSGIALKTDKDITMTATGNISGAATADAKLSGSNVTCEGNMGFTGKGGASAELSSGGMTKVEGSMVNIN